MSDGRRSRNWWGTSGVVAGLAALVTALGGLAVAIKQTGWFESRDSAAVTRSGPASCDAIVGKWAWFIGGEVTMARGGSFVQQSGNAGTWECTDAARGMFTLRWRDGGYVNRVVLSANGQDLSSADSSQAYVTARRTGPGPTP